MVGSAHENQSQVCTPGKGIMRMRGMTTARRRKLLQTLKVLCFIVAGAPALFSQSKPSSDQDQLREITDLELRRAAAVVHRDTDFLDTITSEDSVRILSTGSIETKSQLLSQLKVGAVTYSAIDVDQLDVRVYGNTAVVTGRSVFRGQREGTPFTGQCRFSRVWIKRNIGWQEVLFQLTTTSQP